MIQERRQRWCLSHEASTSLSAFPFLAFSPRFRVLLIPHLAIWGIAQYVTVRNFNVLREGWRRE